MSLSKKAYRSLEDVLGPEYITDEPAVLDGYCYVWGNEMIFGDKFSARPLAVVMPGSTEEVQGIVKICNRFGVKYRAHASGFETTAITSREPFIPIDLRRMNRILEIDEKNRYAVVEPYVTTNKLIHEAMRRGLRPNALGCGPTGSVVAGTAAHFGSSQTNISTDYGARTCLAVEWVLPDGEIIKLGSLGTGAGWFNGDGPGPSLRGVMRGYGGANGGLGVITKVAAKLYPWYGPTKMVAKGKTPLYEWEMPENFSIYSILFPSPESVSDFFHLLVEEAIAFSANRFEFGGLQVMFTESNEDFYELVKNIPQAQLDEVMYHVLVSMDASSKREMDYKEKCLQKILEKTQGMVFPLDDQQKNILLLQVITAQGNTRSTFRLSGSFGISPVGDEAIDSMQLLSRTAYEDYVREKQKSGKFLLGGEGTWSVAYSDVGAHTEVTYLYDPADPESTKAAAEMGELGDKWMAEKRFGINALENALCFEETAIKAALPYSLDFAVWMKKLKKAFDPNLVSESSFYVTPED